MRNVRISLKNVKAAAVGGLVAPAIVASAQNTVMLTQNPTQSFSDGGAFDAVTSQNFIQNYAASATDGGAFETFCIESTVTFAPNVTYYYDLTQADSAGRPLTMGAAYLYYQFATGQLPDYF